MQFTAELLRYHQVGKTYGKVSHNALHRVQSYRNYGYITADEHMFESFQCQREDASKGVPHLTNNHGKITVA